jgi:hypothetical protein
MRTIPNVLLLLVLLFFAIVGRSDVLDEAASSLVSSAKESCDSSIL